MPTDTDVQAEDCPQETPAFEVPSVRRVLLLALGVALVLGALLWWAQGTPSGRKATGKPAAVAAAGPAFTNHAPSVRFGPKVKRGGKLVPTIIVTLAGNAAYNGTFWQVGGETYNGEAVLRRNGDPAGIALWYDSGGSGGWFLSTTPGTPPPPAYGSTGPTLPGNPWSVTNDPPGTAPAPTLAAFSPTTVDPLTWPYANYWWYVSDAPSYPPPCPLRPCRATLGGTAYIVFPYQQASPSRRGFSLFKLSDQTWVDCAADADLYAAGAVDDYQSGACFADADGTHLWLWSGAYDDSGYKGVWSKWAIDAGAKTATLVGSPAAVTLPSLDVSNPVETVAGTVRYLAESSGDWLLCSMDFGDASYSTVATFSDVTPLPSGYAAVELSTTGRLDQVLWLAPNGALYWLRHCAHSSLGTHRVVAHEVTATRCEQLGDVIAAGACDYLQTWGWYAPFSCVCGDLGTTSNPRAAVRWNPGQDAQQALAFTRQPYPAQRQWYLDGGASLYVVGWANAVFDSRPFVVVAAPKEVNVPAATVNLTAYAPSAPAKGIAVPAATVNVTAYPPTIAKVRIIDLPAARVNVVALPPEVIGSANRTPGASVVEWEWVRVSTG